MIQRRRMLQGTVAVCAAPAYIPARAKDLTLTIAAGHPPVIAWVRLLRDYFVPEVNKLLEGSGHKINWNQAYGGTVAKIGGELDAVEKGLVDIAIVDLPSGQAESAERHKLCTVQFAQCGCHSQDHRCYVRAGAGNGQAVGASPCTVPGRYRRRVV
jgi:hypothetical protein